MNASRNPTATRRHLLEVAAEEFHRVGFQTASLADILDKAGVSKGALYHHFANKQELGYAVLEEVFFQHYLEQWLPVLEAENPAEAICQWLEDHPNILSEEDKLFGCPVCDISQEMSAVDEGFRLRVQQLFQTMQENICAGLEKSKQLGQIVSDINSEQEAFLLLVSMQGMSAYVQNTHDISGYKHLASSLRAKLGL